MDTEPYQIIRNNVQYHALILDAFYKKELSEMINTFVIFISPGKQIRRNVKFKMDGPGEHYYTDMCETLGTDGNPRDLIGKAVCLHFEKNGDFQNMRVDALISKEELEEALAEMEDDEEERPGKRKKVSKISKTTKQKAHKKRAVRRGEDDTDESEKLDDESDEDIEGEDYSELDDDFSDFD